MNVEILGKRIELLLQVVRSASASPCYISRSSISTSSRRRLRGNYFGGSP
jgi:hypothetical protein